MEYEWTKDVGMPLWFPWGQTFPASKEMRGLPNLREAMTALT